MLPLEFRCLLLILRFRSFEYAMINESQNSRIAELQSFVSRLLGGIEDIRILAISEEIRLRVLVRFIIFAQTTAFCLSYRRAHSSNKSTTIHSLLRSETCLALRVFPLRLKLGYRDALLRGL